MITPGPGRGSLHRHQIRNVLDNAKRARLPAWIGTNRADRILRNVATVGTTPDLLAGLFQRLDQFPHVLGFLDEQLQRNPFGRAIAEPGQSLELLQKLFVGRSHLEIRLKQTGHATHTAG